MAAGIKELAEAQTRFADRIRIGDADAVEAERGGFARERGLDFGGSEFCDRAQKSRST